MEDREELLEAAHSRLEQDFVLLGAIGIEDRLQAGVPDTIESLLQAGIKVWVLTGDKQATALNIASACRLFSHCKPLILRAEM